ncbi:ABC transporter substrate-binding protein [Halopiger thermotolerans]
MPRKRQSRRTVIKTSGALGAAGIVGLAGCTGNSDGGNGNSSGSGTSDGEMADEITFYNAGSLEFDPGTEDNIRRFEEETGITVNVNEVPWANLKTSLTTIFNSQSPKVDAFNGPTWWLADFVNAGWLEPLDLSDDHMSKFPGSLVDLVSFDGDPYMAPEFGKWGTYLYDTEVVETPPDTWDEILERGPELSSDGRSGFGLTWADKSVFTFKQLLYQAGGSLFNENNEPVFAGDEGQQVMEFITQLRDEDIIPDGISSMGEGAVGDAFIAGEFATVESWTPLGSRAIDEWGEERVGSARPPAGPSGRATFQDTNGISISAFSEKKAAAQRFAEFMTTRESCKNNMLVEGNPCVVPDVYEDDEVQEQYPSWLLEDMKYNLEHAMSETYIQQPQVDDYIDEQITPALLGEKDPQTALEDAQANVTRLYQDIGLL